LYRSCRHLLEFRDPQALEFLKPDTRIEVAASVRTEAKSARALQRLKGRVWFDLKIYRIKDEPVKEAGDGK
jgi:hypothetical protein